MQISRVALFIGVLSAAGLVHAAEVPAGGFLQAIGPRVWKFPQDHGRHDGFKTEWWYFTGNVKTGDGRPFGFQLTIFRTSIAPAPAGRASGWATGDIYFAHAHLSDIQNKKYLVADVASRARGGLAMASDRDLDVTLLDWSIRRIPDGNIHLLIQQRFFAGPRLHLPARTGAGRSGRPEPEGKCGRPGFVLLLADAASTRGHIVLEGNRSKFRTGWMDHEFSSNQLAKIRRAGIGCRCRWMTAPI